MGTIVAGEGTLDPIGGRQRPLEQDEAGERIVEVSGWMMVLGTVRLICAFGAYVGSFLDGLGVVGPSLRALGRYFQDSPPIVVLGSCWPLILALILRRTRNRGLLIAAAVTFLILSLGGILGIVARLTLRTDPTIVFGSFDVSRWGLRHLNPASLAEALLGSIELALELATAAAAWAVAHACRGSMSTDEPLRRLHGRLALYVSLAFLVLYVRVPFWSAYEEVLNRSSLVREFVLKTDRRPYGAYRGTVSAPSRPRGDMELEIRLTKAMRLAAANQVVEAKGEYLDLIARGHGMGLGEGSESDLKPQLARAYNNLAWMLVTCEDERLRQPQEALTYAQRAVKLADEEGNYWNTLGVVWFRLENWASAVDAFEQSMKLRGGGVGDSYDWYFLAMIEARQGREVRSRQWYDRAVAWSRRDGSPEPELFRFQVEAARVLGLEKPAEPEPPKTRDRPGGTGGHGLRVGGKVRPASHLQVKDHGREAVGRTPARAPAHGARPGHSRRRPEGSG